MFIANLLYNFMYFMFTVLFLFSIVLLFSVFKFLGYSASTEGTGRELLSVLFTDISQVCRTAPAAW